ncbi:MAG: GGDEF domain-containing protein, partial [Tepidiformaceae bacterium]
LGGEEFGALFDVPLAEARRLCAGAVDSVGSTPIDYGMESGQVEHPASGVSVTVSGGLTAWLPGTRTREDSVARSYEAADKALYGAKRSGRNRLVLGMRAAA